MKATAIILILTALISRFFTVPVVVEKIVPIQVPAGNVDSMKIFTAVLNKINKQKHHQCLKKNKS